MCGYCRCQTGTYIHVASSGLARALEIAAFDEPIDAAHAASGGLATRIAAAGAALDGPRVLTHELQGRSLASFASSKRLLRRSTETPLEVQLEHERAGIVACARTAEGAEGISAFVGKRAPDFQQPGRGPGALKRQARGQLNHASCAAALRERGSRARSVMFHSQTFRPHHPRRGTCRPG